MPGSVQGMNARECSAEEEEQEEEQEEQEEEVVVVVSGHARQAGAHMRTS